MTCIKLRHSFLAVASGLAAFSVIPVRADQIRSLYFYPAVRYTFSDSARYANNAVGYQVALGHVIDKRWAVELFSDADQFHLLDNTATLHTRGLGVQALYNFSPETDLSPFLLFGGNWLRTDIGNRQEDSPVARAGLGVLFQPEGAAFGLRADAALRHEFLNALSPERNNYDDVTYSLGLIYRFGLDNEESDGIAAYTRPMPPYSAPPPITQQVASNSGGDSGSGQVARSSFRGRVSTGVVTASDGDGDGVSNPKDKCSDTPANAVVDVDGCIIYLKKL